METMIDLIDVTKSYNIYASIFYYTAKKKKKETTF